MLIMRLLHILTSIWFISGLLGRWLAYAQAQRATDVHTAGALLRLSDRFERLMVVPGSQTMLVFGLLTAWLQGLPLLGALQGVRSNWLLASSVRPPASSSAPRLAWAAAKSGELLMTSR